jgi:hypothetical protein
VRSLWFTVNCSLQRLFIDAFTFIFSEEQKNLRHEFLIYYGFYLSNENFREFLNRNSSVISSTEPESQNTVHLNYPKECGETIVDCIWLMRQLWNTKEGHYHHYTIKPGSELQSSRIKRLMEDNIAPLSKYHSLYYLQE